LSFCRSAKEKWAIGLPIFLGLVLSTGAQADPPDGRKVVQAMAELRVVDHRLTHWNESPEWDRLYQTARTAREWGISGVAVDYWMGIIQAGGRGSFDWAYYDLKTQILHDAGQKISAEMSSHLSGVNVADTVFIDTAPHIRAEIPENPRHKDLAYKSEVGARNDGMVSIWGLEYVIGDLKAYFRGFRDHYSDRAHWFEELIVGAGSAGEWRLPAYDEHDRRAGFRNEADWPGRGLLQISSELAQDSLRVAMREKYGTIEALNAAWKLRARPSRGGEAGERFAFADWESFGALVKKEEVDWFLKHHRQYSQMGQDIFGWQHRSLLKAGRMLLEAMIEVFHEKGSPFANTPIAIKLPGVHWSFLHRFPQLASGLISTEGASLDETLPVRQRQPPSWTEANGHGYEGFFTEVFLPLREKYPHSKLFPIFTCAEMKDCHEHCVTGAATDSGCHCAHKNLFSVSGAATLMKGFGNLARKHKQPIRVENAMANGLYDDVPLGQLERTVRDNPWVTGATFLRLYDVARSPKAQDTARRISHYTAESATSAPVAPSHLADELRDTCPDQLVAQATPAAH
jgi:hypothetical protein